MKKFLSPEESLNLLKLGIPESYINYYACEDGRFDSMMHEYIKYFGIRHKSGIATIFSDYRPVFSVADLIKYVTEFIKVSLDEVLEKSNWNFYSYEYEDKNELIDYLHTYILNWLENNPQESTYVEKKLSEPVELSATIYSAVKQHEISIYIDPKDYTNLKDHK